MCSYYIIFAPEKLSFDKKLPFDIYVLFAKKTALHLRKSPAFVVY